MDKILSNETLTTKKVVKAFQNIMGKENSALWETFSKNFTKQIEAMNLQEQILFAKTLSPMLRAISNKGIDKAYEDLAQLVEQVDYELYETSFEVLFEEEMKRREMIKQ